MIKLTLVPREVQDSWEVVEIREGSLPVAIVHIDTFYEGVKEGTYQKLRRGETVTVKLIELRE